MGTYLVLHLFSANLDIVGIGPVLGFGGSVSRVFPMALGGIAARAGMGRSKPECSALRTWVATAGEDCWSL